MKVRAPYISGAILREPRPTAAQNLATAVSPCLLWVRPCIAPLYQISAALRRLSSESRSQRLNVKGR
jgi:hypothetical protein